MQGKRVYLENIDIKSIRLLIPGEYGRTSNGIWWFCTPNGLHSKIDSKKHQIIEHKNGAITINFLISINKMISWRGFLEKGIWRGC
jgi:hypothetical protein